MAKSTKTSSLDFARGAMGNIITPEMVSKHLGVRYPKKELLKLEKVPFSEATLKKYRESHILVAGYPLSIRDIEKKTSKTKVCFNSTNKLFVKRDEVGYQWYLIRKDIGKRLVDEGDDEKMARACVVVYTAVLYYLIYKEGIFNRFMARCVSSLEDQDVYVGNGSDDWLL